MFTQDHHVNVPTLHKDTKEANIWSVHCLLDLHGFTICGSSIHSMQTLQLCPTSQHIKPCSFPCCLYLHGVEMQLHLRCALASISCLDFVVTVLLLCSFCASLYSAGVPWVVPRESIRRHRDAPIYSQPDSASSHPSQVNGQLQGRKEGLSQ